MILLVDNYDSFSYNLYQLLGKVDPQIQVVRNDALTMEEVRNLSPKAIVLSPGPGRPENAGICQELITSLLDEVPIFGVCLGHQAICQALGGKVGYAKELMHGKQKEILRVGESRLLTGLPERFLAARYHSLAAERDSLPSCLKVTAVSPEGEVMAVEHESAPLFGVQFHPESVMTPDGLLMVKNFLSLC